MSERRHGPPFDQLDAAMQGGPARQPLPTEFRMPAETARERGEAFLADRAQSGFGTEMIDQNDFAPRPSDANKLIECRLGIGHRRDHVLRHDDIECRGGKCEMLRIHHSKPVDVDKPMGGDAGLSFAQHRRREIDPDQAVGRGVTGQG